VAWLLAIIASWALAFIDWLGPGYG